MTQDPHDLEAVELKRALRALAGDDRELRVPPHVHAAVMLAWDATTTPLRRRPAQSRRWQLALLAGAAAAAFVAAVALYRGDHNEAPVDNAPITAVGPSVPGAVDAPRLLDERAAKPPTPARRKPRVGRPPRTVAPDAGIVLVADPVLDASALSVVRVRMPRRTLAHFGIPIGDPDATGSVDLEVLVGEDGIARTIRRALPVTGSDPQE